MNIAVACCIEKDYPGEEKTIPGKKRLSRGRKDYPRTAKTIEQIYHNHIQPVVKKLAEEKQ